jgi:hypothetical protein
MTAVLDIYYVVVPGSFNKIFSDPITLTALIWYFPNHLINAFRLLLSAQVIPNGKMEESCGNLFYTKVQTFTWSQALILVAFAPFGLLHFDALPSGLALSGIDPLVLPSLFWIHLGFYHLRLDYPGLRRISTFPEGFCHHQGEATFGD